MSFHFTSTNAVKDLVRGVYDGHDAIPVHASSPGSEIRSQHLPVYGATVGG